MNTGIGDAINLAWKLAWVAQGRAPDSLLDSYEAERLPFARRLVATTDKAFSIATAEGRLADIIHTQLAPIVIPAALSRGLVRDFLFRTVAQITLNYRGGPLSAGKVGDVHGGDRLPWAPRRWIRRPRRSTSRRSPGRCWSTARRASALVAWCRDHGVPLRVFEYDPERTPLASARIVHARSTCCGRTPMSRWWTPAPTRQRWRAISPSAPNPTDANFALEFQSLAATAGTGPPVRHCFGQDLSAEK